MSYIIFVYFVYYIVPCVVLLLSVGVISTVIYRWKKGRPLNPLGVKKDFMQDIDGILSQVSIVISLFLFTYFLLSITKKMDFALEAQYVVLPSLILGYVLSYKLKQQLSFLLSLLATYFWWTWFSIFELTNLYESTGSIYRTSIGSSLGYRAVILPVGILLISLSFSVVAKIHQKRKVFPAAEAIYRLFAVVPPSLFLFLLSIKLFLIEGLEELLEGDPLLIPPILIGVTASMACLIIGATLYIYWHGYVSGQYAIGALMALGIILLLLFVPPMVLQEELSQDYYANPGPSILGYLLLVFFNILIFSGFLGLIYYGYIKKNAGFITIGVVLLFMLCLEKYIEWFSFTEKGIFFTGAGVLMLGLGFFLERTRRKIIININNS